MLQSLYIQDLAIIHKLTLSFSGGLMMITGETGAGKSILIKALDALSGKKISSSIIRESSNAARIVAVFDLSSEHIVWTFLQKAGISFVGNELIIRRQIYRQKRSQTWINDVLVSGNLLRLIFPEMIEIISQHQTQQIFDVKKHQALIDHFLSDRTLLEGYRLAYRCCQEIEKTLKKKAENYTNNEKNFDYIKFRCEQIKSFSPTENDYSHCFALDKKAEKSYKNQEHLGRIMEIFDQGYQQQGLTVGVQEIIHQLESLSSKEWDPFLQDLEKVLSILDECHFELTKKMEKTSYTEDDFAQAQERLAGYQELFRIADVSNISDLLHYQQNLEAGLEAREYFQEDFEKTLLEWESQLRVLGEISKKLSISRRRVSISLIKDLKKELKDLMMSHTKIKIAFHSIQAKTQDKSPSCLSENNQKAYETLMTSWRSFAEYGQESLEILLATNAQSQFQSFKHLASGGEASRILLAIKKIFSRQNSVQAIVFDEIDTGVSGANATEVGRKIMELASCKQIICISHLPQVAVYADRHFLVSKKQEGKQKTFEVCVTALTEQERVQEIARLLSGKNVTAYSLKHADELIRSSRLSTSSR